VPEAPSRLLVVVLAALIAGGMATAIAVAFPGRASQSAAAPTPAGIVQTPQPVFTPEPTPTPAPSPTAAPQTFTTTRRSAPTTVSQPRPRSGSGGDISQLPGPAQKAIKDQPGSPKQPRQP
jgi:hypothetical protein